MWPKAKYIVIKDYEWDREHLIVFDETFTHKMFADNLRRIGELVSAGFVWFNAEKGAQCGGESESLKLKSRGDVDTKLLHKMMEIP